MQFLNPAVLVGLFAALAPLAIHLLHRGRSRPFPFSNLRFLRQVHHSRMRRVRLRQWLVLLLRTLIILLVILAFARPAYRAGGDWWGGSTTPVTAVVLLDRSFSTAQLVSGGTAFGGLQQRAADLAGLFTERDKLVVIPFDETPGLPLTDSLARDELGDRLAALAPGQAGTRLEAALQAAAVFLEKAAPADRELYVLSDMARHGWPEPGAGEALPKARVHVMPAPPGARRNLHVERVEVPSWMPSAGRKLKVVASVGNAGDLPVKDVEVDLFVDGERVRHESVNLAAGAVRQVEMTVTPRRTGTLSGVVELEDDVLSTDNRRYFVLEVPRRIAVVLLGEKPADTYYLRRALGAAAQADPVLSVQANLLQDLEGMDLTDADVLVLSNLHRLNRSATRKVHEFVADGGGLVLVPGANADLTYLNRDLLPGLIPAALRKAARPGAEGFQRLDGNRKHHPLFAALLHDQHQEEIRFAGSFHMTAREGLEVLAHFEDGRPALAAGRRGKGRVLLWAVPLELDWTDVPLRGLFVPMWHRIVRELALPAARHERYLVGQPVRRLLEGVPVASEVQVETPSGQRLLLEPELRGSQYHWKIPRVNEAGIWRLRLKDREVDRFAVNVDARESDLAQVSPERVHALLGGDRTVILEPEEDVRTEVLSRRYGRELWRELLALAVLLLMVELWVARSPHQVRGRPAAPAT